VFPREFFLNYAKDIDRRALGLVLFLVDLLPAKKFVETDNYYTLFTAVDH